MVVNTGLNVHYFSSPQPQQPQPQQKIRDTFNDFDRSFKTEPLDYDDIDDMIGEQDDDEDFYDEAMEVDMPQASRRSGTTLSHVWLKLKHFSDEIGIAMKLPPQFCPFNDEVMYSETCARVAVIDRFDCISKKKIYFLGAF